jgi:hypothetical protein
MPQWLGDHRILEGFLSPAITREVERTIQAGGTQSHYFIYLISLSRVRFTA